MTKKPAKKEKWLIYLVECVNKTFYTGITNDLEKRIRDHNARKGGKYTRAFGPVRLRWNETVGSKSKALKREAAIKKMSRIQKMNLILTQK